MSRKLKDVEGRLVDKTISKVDASAVNTLTLYFTDGSSITIEVEYMGHNIYGMVALPEAD